MEAAGKAGNWRGAVASTIGNVLEWYDFVLFGFLTLVIAKQFFPSSSPYGGLLMTTATFGAGFVVRPIGGVLLGIYSDRHGRKAGLTMVIMMMTIASAIVAFTPGFHQIGIVAPLLVVFARLLQGVSAGGEFGTATAMLVEYAPKGRRSFYGSWQMFAQALGALIAIAMGALLTGFFSPATVESWAWRLPFAFGLLIGPVGIYIRNRMPETEAFRQLTKPARAPLGKVLTDYPKEVFISTSMSAALNVMSYVIFTFLPIFAVQTLGMPIKLPFTVLLLSVTLRISTIPLFGWLGDRVGQKRVMSLALVAFLITLYPSYYWMIHAPSMTSILAVESVFAILTSAATSSVPSASAQLFPTSVRSTGLAISYNIGASLFGGFSPFILTWLLHVTGDKFMPAHYATLFFALGLIGVLMLRSDKDDKPVAEPGPEADDQSPALKQAH
ncbi:MFS transporter [Paraburkholderia fungorum]|uniref:MFS transporter n=1 Tax=Paraburkholderia fungorum TaxID=134537 RepID=UPI0038BBF9AC